MRPGVTGVWGRAAMALLILLGARAGWGEPSPAVRETIWDKSLTLRGSLGYKDNPLLTQARAEGSGFWQSSADLSLFNAGPGRSSFFSFYLSAEDRRYFSAPRIGGEQLVLSQMKFEVPFAERWKWGAVVQYVYANQVMDASSTEELLRTLQVRSHNLQWSPLVSRQLPWQWKIEARFHIERQWFNEPLDDYWELTPQVVLSRPYGHRSELSLSYQADQRAYDTRGQIGRDRRSLPGSSLRFEQHETELALNHVWDQARRWRTRSRFLFEVNQDNGPGYYDYRRYRWAQRFGYYTKNWQATVEGKVLHHAYEWQPVPGRDEPRQNWDYSLGVQFEKTLWRSLRLVAESEHETVHSNYELEEYVANTITAGLEWEF